MEVSYINNLFFNSAALSTPQNLMFIDNSIQDTSIAVNWTEVSDTCAIGYVVLVYANGNVVVNITTQDNKYTITENIIDAEYCIAVATHRLDGANGTPTSQLCITLASKCSLRECNNYDINNNILGLSSNDLKQCIYYLLFTLSLQHPYLLCLMNLPTH